MTDKPQESKEGGYDQARIEFEPRDIQEVERLFRFSTIYPDEKECDKQRAVLWGRLDQLVNELYPAFLDDEESFVNRPEEVKAYSDLESALTRILKSLDGFSQKHPHAYLLSMMENEVRGEIQRPQDYMPPGVSLIDAESVGPEVDLLDPQHEEILGELAKHVDVELSQLRLKSIHEYFSQEAPVFGFEELYLPPNALLSMVKLHIRGLHRMQEGREAYRANRPQKRVNRSTLTRERTASVLAGLWETIGRDEVRYAESSRFVRFLRIIYSYLQEEEPSKQSIKNALRSRMERQSKRGVA